jgi:hypothetical protein
MALIAALVYHSVIVELNIPSYRFGVGGDGF